MKLSREMRCYPNADRKLNERNTWSGLPPLAGPPMFWVLRAVVDGPVDPKTGYLYDLSDLDSLLRGQVVSTIIAARQAGMSFDQSLPQSFTQARTAIAPPASLFTLELAISPFLHYAVHAGDPNMVEVTQSFEFSAGHQLWCDDFDEAQNRRVFGKCSNPNGHGHNYIVEVTVSGPADETTGIVINLEALSHIVNEKVIQPFDHKFLNRECADFASLNPSVENIARVIWLKLVNSFDQVKLARVRVWETPKTSATYCGESAQPPSL